MHPLPKRTRGRLAFAVTGLLIFSTSTASAQQPCALSAIPPTLTVPHRFSGREVIANPAAPDWSGAGTSELHRDCTHTRDYPELLTTVRAFWTDRYIYFLFTAPYHTQNLFLPVH